MAYARHRARGQDRDPDRPRATGRSASQSRRGRARGAPRVDGAVREQSGNFGFDYWMVDRRELADILPGLSPAVSGASWMPYDGHANPLNLLHALHKGFVENGGRYLPNGTVTEAMAAAGDFRIRRRCARA